MHSITVRELARHHAEQPVELIDVRTHVEFSVLHASPAKNVPLSELDPDAVMARHAEMFDDQPLYLICQSGKRSSRAAEKFLAAGYDNIINVIGGTQAWQATGLPIEQNEQVISLERQVRIAAGTVTLLGILLAYLIHPFFLVVAIFVGAGLVFAGISDTCGMGLLLSRMPWNRSLGRDLDTHSQST
ncbi:rhodanese-like domain-containing protein [Rubripirellula sp.]|nr:rhodanese-like domain-containing protein [Rubripirellula sp.]MDB4639413.1 rhodanese-like domain-containing protein [bacterium]MDB4654019.1 rhodanese-like domain-containing protein [bacterium]